MFSKYYSHMFDTFIHAYVWKKRKRNKMTIMNGRTRMKLFQTTIFHLHNDFLADFLGNVRADKKVLRATLEYF